LDIFGYRFLPILANILVKFGYKAFWNLATLLLSLRKLSRVRSTQFSTCCCAVL